MPRNVYCIVLLLGLTRPTLGQTIPGVETTEHYNQSLVLDGAGNYLLFWNYNDTHVTFEVHVKTRGWVGFGISENGNMYPSDVVIGWIDSEGTAHFADRHATAHQMPEVDKHQDWFLLYSEENDFGTVLKFVRKRDTCDVAEDKVIQDGTTRIIYAYNEVDPASDEVIEYHGQTRGTKSVALFSTYRVPDSLPDDVITFDFLNQNYVIPDATTTYWCVSFLMPNIGKHHMIKFEPVVTRGNEMTVHHILLYRCRVQDPEASAGKSGMCYQKRPADLPECSNVFLAWAIGGKEFYFPEDVGFPVGDPSESSFYIMETHYDNPNKKFGVLDNSGLRITLTKQFRPKEAGLLMTGQAVGRYQVIPPNEKSFISKGFCSADCMNKSMSQDNVEQIHVFAACQHAHLLGRAIKTRLIRGDTELEPLADEPNYDFNFQETRILKEERIVYPTDSIEVDCTYNSKNRKKATFGGLTTQEEMCLSFLYYYPRLAVHECTSTQSLAPTIPNMKDVARLYNTFDWSNKTAVEELMELQRNSLVQHSCLGEDLHLPDGELYTNFLEKEPKNPYVPPKPQCS